MTILLTGGGLGDWIGRSSLSNLVFLARMNLLLVCVPCV